jgi:oxygen-independent coproporphyrinogen-3 oxidase
LELGINRLSFGVQSFLEKNLQFLGRWHSHKEGIRAILEAKSAGFENLSIDLIYGLPGQTTQDLQEELKIVKDLPINHLSAYLLTPYEDTSFINKKRFGNHRNLEKYKRAVLQGEKTHRNEGKALKERNF